MCRFRRSLGACSRSDSSLVPLLYDLIEFSCSTQIQGKFCNELLRVWFSCCTHRLEVHPAIQLYPCYAASYQT